MRHFDWSTCLRYSLTAAFGLQCALTQPLRAEAAAEREDAEAVAEQEQPQEEAPAADAPQKEQAAAPPIMAIKKRAPLYELPELKPIQLIKTVPQVAPKPALRPTPKPVVKQKPAPQQLPARGRPNLPFWLPHQSGLSSAATYQLNSLGRHIQLNPATRFHLHRANGGMPIETNQQVSSAASAPDQGAAKFYPGVSRLPTQKPFANVQPEPTGLQRYWPLLLEGREDPNTGLILWTLP